MQHPSTSHARPMRAFNVTLCAAGGRFAYTALARSSGDALIDALSCPGLVLPVAASVKPAGAACHG